MTRLGRPIVSIALLLGTLLFVQLRSRGEAIPIRQPLDAFPLAVGSWQGREATIFEVGILNVLKVKDYLMRRFVDQDGRSLWLYIGYWDNQKKGAQPHSPRNCLPGGGWEPLEAAKVRIAIPGLDHPITVNRYLIQKDQTQQLVFYWYQQQGKVIAGEVAARIDMVKNSIANNRTDGALVRVSGTVQGSVAQTSEGLTGFIQAMYPTLGQFLPE
jgi:EpsI family protein